MSPLKIAFLAAVAAAAFATPSLAQNFNGFGPSYQTQENTSQFNAPAVQNKQVALKGSKHRTPVK